MVYVLCLYFMTGAPEGSTESGFMGKPGIEPATPGFTRKWVIHVNALVLPTFLWV